jgi:hypothetical protein
MKLATLLSVGILMLAQNTYASVSNSINEKWDCAQCETLLSQHLWDEEWSVPLESEEISVDEALLLDSPEMNESEMVAVLLWDWSAAPENDLVEGEIQISQHLWDEEWSVPLESEEISVDEALLLDAPKIDETQLIAGSIWNIEVQSRAVS